MPLPPPVIVVPGITATYLSDEYPLPPEVVWSVMTNKFERVRFHPDNVLRSKDITATRWYEADEPARVLPGQLFEVAYKELIQELRHNLTAKADQPVPVYPFGYDWRHPLEQVEAALADFVNEVIERTKLMRHYAKDGYANAPRVNLVGHSMGGLVIAGYLREQAGQAPVSKVATLASPFRGSFEAVIKVITGTANLGTSAPSSREREASRATPALYYLFPSFNNGLEVDPGLPTSLFDPGMWQGGGVTQTLEEYVRLYAVDPGKKAEHAKQAQDLLDAMLKAAEGHRKKLDSIKLANLNLAASDWLAVVGVGSTTRVRLHVAKGKGGKPEFDLRSTDRADQWVPKPPAGASDNRDVTGDGTVPFEGALPGFLARENLVCVSPDDYGYWEIEDKVLAKVGGFHGTLPNMNLLHRLIVRHFTGAKDAHGNTWGRAAPGVAKKDWAPPIPNLLHEP
jgi:pimeloyl-ACP methyl ester carboxylesterase